MTVTASPTAAEIMADPRLIDARARNRERAAVHAGYQRGVVTDDEYDQRLADLREQTVAAWAPAWVWGLPAPDRLFALSLSAPATTTRR